MNRLVVRCAFVLSIVALVVIMVCSAFSSLLFNHQWYHDEYVKNGVFWHVGPNTTMKITVNLFDYFHGKDALQYFTPQEQSHLADVKARIQTVFLVYGLAILVLVLCIVFLIREQVVLVAKRHVYTRAVKSIAQALLIASLCALALVGIIAGASFADFSGVFDVFHQLLFPAGNYTFPEDSLLITLFPEQFFQDIAQQAGMRIAITAGLTALVAGGILVVLKKRSRK